MRTESNNLTGTRKSKMFMHNAYSGWVQLCAGGGSEILRVQDTFISWRWLKFFPSSRKPVFRRNVICKIFPSSVFAYRGYTFRIESVTSHPLSPNFFYIPKESIFLWWYSVFHVIHPHFSIIQFAATRRYVLHCASYELLILTYTYIRQISRYYRYSFGKYVTFYWNNSVSAVVNFK